jgi:hypothetical protein
MSELMTKCTVCRGLIDQEDLFCANCGTEAPHDSEVAEPNAPGTVTHNFECQGCSASMSYDAQAGTVRCPFCGSENVKEKPAARVLMPEHVVPFKVSRADAEEVMRETIGRGFWRPGDLSQEAQVTKMMPVYVPYWIFEAHTHTYWTADSSDTPGGARAAWYPMSGEHHGNYKGILVGASGALTPAETADICPFDLRQSVPPERIDLENYTVEQFGVQRKYARPLARQGLEQREAAECASRYVPGRSRNVHVNVRFEGLSSEPVLLPVWIMAYRYEERVYRFLVNGESARGTGQAPTSWTKVAIAAAVGVGVVLLLLVGLMILAS